MHLTRQHFYNADISEKALAKASYGSYTKMELDRGMPDSALARAFVKQDDNWRIKDELRAKVSSNRFETVMEPGASLIIGSTESLLGICPQYTSKRYLRSVFYQLG